MPQLPILREELALYPGGHLADGQPSWTLHDPVRNQFFRIDWQSFEVFSRWALGDPQAICHSVAAQTTLRPDASDIAALVQFLVENQLVQPQGSASSQQMADRLGRMRGNWQTWLLHHYLFFRIPLVRPDAWLNRWSAAAAPLFTRGFAQLTLLALLLGGIEVYRDWGRFSATLLDTFTWEGVLGFGLALSFVKVLHELGHAFTAKRFGCQVPVMGVAFLVLWPVAYTDTNEVWKLQQRRQRLAVAGAGVATELVVAVWATLAWGLLPEGLAKSIAFMLASTTWIATLAVNTSPFMRFDGYFFLVDWLDMPNLHSRAFALARWDLRERLFGLQHPPPEHFPPRRRLGLILFAYATWMYRLVVFLGIAALVYAFFIKLVGIFLFLVEIIWFVALPLWKEIKSWPALLKAAPLKADPMHATEAGQSGSWAQAWRRYPRLRRSLMLGSMLLLLFVLPWPTRQSAAGLLHPAEVFPLYAPAGSQVVKLPWREGSRVETGQVLLELAAPELQLRWQRAQARTLSTREQLGSASLDPSQRHNLPLLQQEEKAAQAEVDSVQAELARYAPVAPFAGRLRDLDPALQAGTWVSAREKLGLLVRTDGWLVETWLDEEAIRRVALGDQARFFTDGLEGPVLVLQVSEIDRDASRVLPTGLLAAQFGGTVLTREKHGQLIPERAIYRVVLRSDQALDARLADQSWRGRVVIHGQWEAPGLTFARAALVLVWRELGF